MRVEAITGRDKVEAIELAAGKKKETLKVDGVLVHIGLEPNTGYLEGIVPLDKQGQVIVNEKMEIGSALYLRRRRYPQRLAPAGGRGGGGWRHRGDNGAEVFTGRGVMISRLLSPMRERIKVRGKTVVFLARLNHYSPHFLHPYRGYFKLRYLGHGVEGGVGQLISGAFRKVEGHGDGARRR